MPSELVLIADQLRRAAEGEAWHGPSIMEILNGVDSATAAARPVAGAHSIWEILHHITAWTVAVLRRLNGQVVELTGPDDWPPATAAGEDAWQSAIASFREAQQALLARIKTMTSDELSRPAPGKEYTASFMLHGLVQHHLYHAGQVAILKKAALTAK